MRTLTGPEPLLLIPALLLLAAVARGQQPANLLDHGDCEAVGAQLSLGSGSAPDDTLAHSGRASYRVTVPAGGTADQASAEFALTDLAPERTYTVSAWLRWAGVTSVPAKEGYAFLAAYQYDEFDGYLSYYDFVHRTGDGGWERFTYTFTTDREVARVRIPFGLFQATGTLWLDDITLVEGDTPRDIGEVSEPQPTGPPVPELAPGERGNVAILSDTLPVVGAASDPQRLRDLLSGAGYGVALLDSKQLADKRILAPDRYFALVLPYGESFPAGAGEALRAYLKGGGNLLTLGGYALNNLVWPGGQAPAAATDLGPSEASWNYEIPVTPEMGTTFTFSGRLTSAGVQGQGFAYLAVYQYSAAGELVAWRDTIHLTGTRDWTADTYAFALGPGAVTLHIKIGLYICRGSARFDEISLKDAAGNELVRDTGFEQATVTTERAPHRWYVTQPQLSRIMTGTTNWGKQCARVVLHHATPEQLVLNTARGWPADSLQVTPEQIGIFDAGFPLQRVSELTAAAHQSIAPADLRLAAPLTGWAATTVLGYDEARRIPVVMAQDRYGRPRGSAVSLTHRYGGYYQGSSWAIWGVDDRDLLDGSSPAMDRTFVDLVERLRRETFLRNLTTNWATYRQGEPVVLQVTVQNNGLVPATGEVRLALFPEDRTHALNLDPVPVSVAPGATQPVEVTWNPGRFDATFYRVEATLDLEGAPSPWDWMETGFVVWDEGVVKRGPDCVLQDNLFRVNGRELMLQGTDSFSVSFASSQENPLVWKRDFARMRDEAMNLPENLQVDAGSQPTPYEWPEKLLRQIDAMMQLCQQYGQVYMPGLLIGHNVVCEDEVLEQEAGWVKAFAERYHDVPGFIYYINGDFQLDMAPALQAAEKADGAVPRTDVERLWNEYLRSQYADTAALRAAWGDDAVPELGSVPLSSYGSQQWGDMHAVDTHRFQIALMRRWIERHVRAIREVDTHHAITSEYYRLPVGGIDIVATIGGHDCADIGYFDGLGRDIPRMPASLRFADLRARGKSLSAGEFGVKIHPAWGGGTDYDYHTTRTERQAEELWLAMCHYGWGLGASKIHNWCWKDAVEWIFPWGLNYPGDFVKKDYLDVYRACGLLFRQFQRQYTPPSVYVLTPDTHRQGASASTVFEATLNCLNSLQALGIPFGTLNECAEPRLDARVKTVFYPIPYIIPDKVYGELVRWVRDDAGTLYVSGDVSYDSLRQPKLRSRLTELCGVEFVSERFPNIAVGETPTLPVTVGGEAYQAQPGLVCRAAGAEVLLQAQDGTPLVFEYHLGAGRVVFTPWPLELDAAYDQKTLQRNARLYAFALSGVPGIASAPERMAAEPGVMPVPLQAPEGMLWVNTGDRRCDAEAVAPETAAPVALSPGGTGFRDSAGRAVETADRAHVLLYTLDGRPVDQSRRLCLTAIEEGEVTLRATDRWQDPVAVVGEVLEGRFRTYETVALPRARRATLDIDECRRLCQILVCDRGDVAECGRLLERSLSAPWQLP